MAYVVMVRRASRPAGLRPTRGGVHHHRRGAAPPVDYWDRPSKRSFFSVQRPVRVFFFRSSAPRSSARWPSGGPFFIFSLTSPGSVARRRNAWQSPAERANQGRPIYRYGLYIAHQKGAEGRPIYMYGLYIARRKCQGRKAA